VVVLSASKSILACLNSRSALLNSVVNFLTAVSAFAASLLAQSVARDRPAL